MDDDRAGGVSSDGVFYGLAAVSRQADVFSRGSLVLTYELLRKAEPQLALLVRNIVHGPALQNQASRAAETRGGSLQKSDLNNDHFRVVLEGKQVRAIVEALARHREIKETGSGNAVLAQSLIEDWAALAQQMIKKLSGKVG